MGTSELADKDREDVVTLVTLSEEGRPTDHIRAVIAQPGGDLNILGAAHRRLHVHVRRHLHECIHESESLLSPKVTTLSALVSTYHGRPRGATSAGRYHDIRRPSGSRSGTLTKSLTSTRGSTPLAIQHESTFQVLVNAISGVYRYVAMVSTVGC